MNIKKSLLVAGAAATIGVAGLSGLGIASAAPSASGDSLAGKIATRFGLKEADVQAVFDEEKAERNAERQAELSDQLQNAVNKGDITAAQRTLIENKLQELSAARDAEMRELEQWAGQQGIELRYVKMVFGPGDYLQGAADDGKITAVQKTAIVAKQSELRAKHDAAHEALEKWANDNGISERFLMFGKIHGVGMDKMDVRMEVRKPL